MESSDSEDDVAAAVLSAICNVVAAVLSGFPNEEPLRTAAATFGNRQSAIGNPGAAEDSGRYMSEGAAAAASIHSVAAQTQLAAVVGHDQQFRFTGVRTMA
jgi:hypothetical protein